MRLIKLHDPGSYVLFDVLQLPTLFIQIICSTILSSEPLFWLNDENVFEVVGADTRSPKTSNTRFEEHSILKAITD